jgi:hypothetical protein
MLEPYIVACFHALHAIELDPWKISYPPGFSWATTYENDEIKVVEEE